MKRLAVALMLALMCVGGPVWALPPNTDTVDGPQYNFTWPGIGWGAANDELPNPGDWTYTVSRAKYGTVDWTQVGVVQHAGVMVAHQIADTLPDDGIYTVMYEATDGEYTVTCERNVTYGYPQSNGCACASIN